MRSRQIGFGTILIALAAPLAGSAWGSPRYVDDDAPDGNDGRSWATPYNDLNEALREAADDYDRRATAGETRPIYRFDHEVLGPESLRIDPHGIAAPGYTLPIDLDVASPYPEMS